MGHIKCEEFIMKKICFVSSSGGHFSELLCLKELSKIYPSFLITEKNDFSSGDLGYKKYLVPQINRREKFFLFHFLKLFLKEFIVLRKEKPSYIISTGALASFPVCFMGKFFFGMKIIYIESFARTRTPSLTGKLVYPFANLFIVQWEELLEYYPKAKYIGGIF